MQTCLAGGATRLLFRLLRSFTTRLCKDVYGELNTPGSPSGLWQPGCSCSLRTSILANMVLKASARWTDWDCQGWGWLGSCAVIYRACTSAPRDDSCQLDRSPGQAGSRGLEWTGTSVALAQLMRGLHISALPPGWRELGKQRAHSHSPRSLSLVVFSNLHDHLSKAD